MTSSSTRVLSDRLPSLNATERPRRRRCLRTRANPYRQQTRLYLFNVNCTSTRVSYTRTVVSDTRVGCLRFAAAVAFYLGTRARETKNHSDPTVRAKYGRAAARSWQRRRNRQRTAALMETYARVLAVVPRVCPRDEGENHKK